MSLILRPYQEDQYAQARALIKEGVRNVLIQSPTGSGKTVLVAQMLKTCAERGYSAFFNVHRRELVKQSVLTLNESAGLDCGIVAAGFPGNRHQRVQVCSIQTLGRRKHLLGKPHLIIWDEAHHCAAASWDALHKEYPDAVHIGLSATPERLDGTGLKKYFHRIVIGPSVRTLIEQGFLSSYRLFAPTPPDLDGVHTVAGDYNKKELAAAMRRSSVTGDVISHYRKYADGKRMVVFAWSIEASLEIAAKFNAAGIKAAHLDGETDNATRDMEMERFQRGENLILCNVDLFSEGVDVPAIEAVALLRPTKSLALYLQQVGRALRPAPGKDYAVVLDHAGNCRRHGLPDDEREWSLEGRRKEKQRDAAPIKQCPQCYAVMTVSAESCKHCGFVFAAMPRDIAQVEGELSEHEEAMQRAASRDERMREQAQAKSYDDLLKIAQLRGYKNPEKWAGYVWKSREAKRIGREAREFAMGGGR